MFINKISDEPNIPGSLKNISDVYPFKSNDYYLSLINWKDPNDPIRKLIIPSPKELKPWKGLDASNEQLYTPVKGCEHKYNHTALLLISNTCAGYCRFCFRKRLFNFRTEEVDSQATKGIEYIKSHPEIYSVLLTGGDSLMLMTDEIKTLLSKLNKIPHVGDIRFGTKIPAYYPQRISEDAELIDVIRKNPKAVYIITHYNHPRELSKESLLAIRMLKEARASVYNQTPLLKGVNDNPKVLAELLKKLETNGISPYYIFINRPVDGNGHFSVPIEKCLDIVKEAKCKCSGLSRRVRLVMSHATGKIEILAKDKEKIYMKYHRAADPSNHSKLMIYNKNPEAYWLEDYHKEIS